MSIKKKYIKDKPICKVRFVLSKDEANYANTVNVVGDFNQWDGRKHPMRLRGMSGIWELFVPELHEGECVTRKDKTRQV